MPINEKTNAVAFRQYAGQGTENITAKDLKLPILKILHASSPVLDESEAKYNEKAKQGDIYNEITGSLYKSKDGVFVVPCGYVNTFNEWADRGDSPGRPIAVHTDQDIMTKTIRDADNKDRLDNGHYVEDTGNHFVYILNKDYDETLDKMFGKLWWVSPILTHIFLTNYRMAITNKMYFNKYYIKNNIIIRNLVSKRVII